jgi:hypothetical protein
MDQPVPKVILVSRVFLDLVDQLVRREKWVYKVRPERLVLQVPRVILVCKVILE